MGRNAGRRRGADISASIAPIGAGGPSGQRIGYFWLDLRNQGPGPQALCGAPSVFGSTGNGPRAPAGLFGMGGSSPCGGIGSENLIGPGGHLIIGLKVPLPPDMVVQRLTRLTVRTDALTPAGAVLTDASKRAITIVLNGGQLRHLPKLGELPAITASRKGASFGGWSAVVRQAGDSGPANTRPAYWISLVNGRKEDRLCVGASGSEASSSLARKRSGGRGGQVRGKPVCGRFEFAVDTGWRLVGSDRRSPSSTPWT